MKLEQIASLAARVIPALIGGVTWSSSSGGRLDFSLPVPRNIEPTNYLGNCFLFYCNYFGVSDYFDRCQFILNVT